MIRMTAVALPGPKGLAQLVTLRRLLRDPQPVLDELQATFGPVCALGWRPARIAIVGEPAALRALFALPVESFRWGHRFNALGFVVGPASMIVSDGADHKRRRASVQAAFTRRRLNGWIPTIVERTDIAIDGIASLVDGRTDTIDLYPVGRALVLEIIVRTMFGEHLAAHVQELGDLFQRPQDYLESPALRQLPHPFPFTKRARVRHDRRALDAIIDAQIAERRRHPAGEPVDVLESLVQNEALSDAEIRDQVVTLIAAGYDTTTAAVSWLLARAVATPGVWSRLQAEADAHLDRDVEKVGAGVLSELRWSSAVAREALRLHPPGVFAPRETTRALRVGPYRVRRGTLVMWSPYLMGRDPGSWGRPLEFRPERFAAVPNVAARADRAWAPFGRGSRSCIGFALAQMEMALIPSRLAQLLDIELTERDVPAPTGMVVSRPRGGLPARVRRRSACVG